MEDKDLFEYLFAYRVHLTDTYDDEYEIIKELKKDLAKNYNNDEINQKLFDFYAHYSLNINMETIKSIHIANVESTEVNNDDSDNLEPEEENKGEYKEIISVSIPLTINPDNSPMLINPMDVPVTSDPFMTSFLNNFVQNVNSSLRSSNLSSQDINSISHSRVMNMIHSFVTQMNNDNYEMKDIVMTTDDKVLEELPSVKLEKNKEEKCTICMGSLDIDDMVSELICHHTFHTECIKSYLKDYAYKCPVCRVEVGKSKANF